MIAQTDPELSEWLLGITNNTPTRPGDFLRSLAEAALRADGNNYLLLRPALLAIKANYPGYKFDAYSEL